MLMVKPRIAVLNTKPTNEWASTTRRMARPATPISEVCTATLMVNEVVEVPVVGVAFAIGEAQRWFVAVAGIEQPGIVQAEDAADQQP